MLKSFKCRLDVRCARLSNCFFISLHIYVCQIYSSSLSFFFDIEILAHMHSWRQTHKPQKEREKNDTQISIYVVALQLKFNRVQQQQSIVISLS